MALSEKLQYVLDFNVDGGIKSLQKLGNTADKELKKADNRLDKLGKNLTKFGLGALAAAGVAGTALYKMGQGAADTEAAFSALNQVVGETAAQGLARWAEDGAEKVGLAKGAIYEAATTFGMFGKEAGMAGAELDGFIKSQITMAADWAAFKNTTPEQVIQDIRAAYAGSSETLQKYIGTVNDAAIRQAYFEATGEKVTGTLSGQQRIIGLNTLMMQKGADMAGQFARESGELSGQQAIAAAQLKNLSDEIGAGVLPMLVKLFGVANKLISAFSSLNDVTGGNLGTFAAYGTAALATVGSLALVVGQIIKMRKAFVDLRGVMLRHPVLTIATVVGVAAGAIGLFGANANDAAHKVKEMADRIREAEDAMSGLSSEITRLVTDNDNLRQAMVAANLTTQELLQAVLGGGEPLSEFAARVRDGADAAGLSATETLAAVVALRELAQANKLAGQTTEELGQVTKQAAESTEETTVAQKLSAQQTAALRLEQNQYVRSLQDANTEVKANKEALEGSNWYLRKQREDAERASRAIDGLRESHSELRDELSDRSAYLDVEDAFDAVERAAKEAWEAAAKGAEDAEQKSRYYERAQIALKQRVLDYTDAIGGIPEEVTSRIVTLIDEGQLAAAEAAVANLTRQRYADVLLRISGRTPTGDGGFRGDGGLIGRAGGGVVREDVTLVGERGPELVSLPRGSRVHTSQETRRMLSSRPTINIENVVVNDPVTLQALAARLMMLGGIA